MSTRSDEGAEGGGRGNATPAPGRDVREERWSLLRSTWVLNPGIPHFVDFPPPDAR